MKDRIRDKLEDRGLTDDELIARIEKRRKEHLSYLVMRRIKYDPGTKEILLGPEQPLALLKKKAKK